MDPDGHWALDKIQFFFREEQLRNLVFVLVCEGHGLVLAENLTVGPGDEFVIEDTAFKGPPLEVQFTLADGRSAANAGMVSLTSDSLVGGSRMRAQRSVDERGRLSLPSIAPGEW